MHTGHYLSQTMVLYSSIPKKISPNVNVTYLRTLPITATVNIDVRYKEKQNRKQHSKGPALTQSPIILY